MTELTHPKVFGVGFSKTGTTSLELALEQLGLKVCKGHWNNNLTNFLCANYKHNDIEEILHITKCFDAFADGPWGGGKLYLELTKHYPEAYYIHSIRDAEKWYSSFRNMLLRFDPDPKTALSSARAAGCYGTYTFFKYVFGTEDFSDHNKNMVMDYYCQYNENVQKHLKENAVKVLTVDLTTDASAFEKIIIFLNMENKVMVNLPNGTKAPFSVVKGQGVLQMPHMNQGGSAG